MAGRHDSGSECCRTSCGGGRPLTSDLHHEIELVPTTEIGHPDHGRIWLEVDGRLRQEGDLSDQIWPVADVIAHLSCAMALRAGDVILTGTPAGVGRIDRAARVTGGIDSVGSIAFRLV